jgi:hypothetical protein
MKQTAMFDCKQTTISDGKQTEITGDPTLGVITALRYGYG